MNQCVGTIPEELLISSGYSINAMRPYGDHPDYSLIPYSGAMRRFGAQQRIIDTLQARLREIDVLDPDYSYDYH